MTRFNAFFSAARPSRLAGMALLALLLLAACKPQEEKRVRLVVLHSRYCMHCRDVIEAVINPVLEEHAGSLETLWLEVSEEQGRRVFMEAAQRAGVAISMLPTPVILLGGELYAGSAIEEEFPQELQQKIGQDIGWPDLQSLREILAAAATAQP